MLSFLACGRRVRERTRKNEATRDGGISRNASACSKSISGGAEEGLEGGTSGDKKRGAGGSWVPVVLI